MDVATLTEALLHLREQARSDDEYAQAVLALEALADEQPSSFADKSLAFWLTKASAHADGDEWQTNGRWYRREGGRTHRIAKPGGEAGAPTAGATGAPTAEEQPEKEQAADKGRRGVSVEDVHAQAQEMLRQGKVSPDDARELAASMMSLTVAQLGELKKKLGLKASGAKAKLAQTLAERALAAGREKGADNYEHARAHAALTNILGDLSGLDLSDTAAVKDALRRALGQDEAKPEPKDEPEAKPAEQQPTPKEPLAAHSERQVYDAAKAAYDRMEQEFGATSVVPKVSRLVDIVKEKMPGITTEQVHRLLEKWQDEDRLTLQLVNDPHHDPDAARDAIRSPRGLLGYIDWHRGATPPAPKEAPKREPKPYSENR